MTPTSKDEQDEKDEQNHTGFAEFAESVSCSHDPSVKGSGVEFGG